METFLQDLRFGFRMMRRNLGFTAIAALSLALGIGANTAIFSLINAVLLRPLPFRDPDRLAMIWEDASFAGFPRNTPAPANYLDWKAQSRTFEDMAAAASRGFSLTGDGDPERVEAYDVTGNFFSLLGSEPVLGRVFRAEDDRPEANKVAVISYGLWQRRFGGEKSIVGKDILLNGEKYVVLGVMPAGFQFMDKEIDLWTPIAFTQRDAANRGGHYLWVFGRMKSDATLEQAQIDIQTVMQRIAKDHPDEAGRLSAFVVPLQEEFAGEVRRPFIVLLVAVGFVLLIACANIANLLLSRAASRAKEIAVRAALGAGRLRIARQLLTESVLLAGLGGALGLLFAFWSFSFLQQLIPPSMALSTGLTIDSRALLFTLLLSLITGVVFGLAPALQASKIDLNQALKQGFGRGGGESRRLRNAMVAAEVALALVLLAGAALLMQTFYRLRYAGAGFHSRNVLTLRTALPRTKYREHTKRVAFYDSVLERVKSLPGVVSAGYSTSVPLVWKGGTSGFWVEGRTIEQAKSQGLSFDANHRQVSADYLKTMGIPLMRGRHLTEADNLQSLSVAMINETMARQYWPNEDAVGKRFKLGDPDENIPWITVVGIAGDIKEMGLTVPVKAEMYLPYKQTPDPIFFTPQDLIVRTAGDPMDIVSAVKQAVFAADPYQPVSNIRTMDDILDAETTQQRLGTALLTAFAASAMLLATLGIYGVLSYFVLRHTPEIGVRLALGAQPRDILEMVLKKGMGLVLIGAAIGLIASLALTQLMGSLLYGVSAADPATYAAITLLLIATAFLACWIPARRAMKVDPMIALRYE